MPRALDARLGRLEHRLRHTGPPEPDLWRLPRYLSFSDQAALASYDGDPAAALAAGDAAFTVHSGP